MSGARTSLAKPMPTHELAQSNFWPRTAFPNYCSADDCMSEFTSPPASAAPWHALLAPIPADAVVSRKPVASPEILATPEGAAIAGWEQLTIELSAGAVGLRH